MLSQQFSLKLEMQASLRANPDQFNHSVFEFDLVNGKPSAPSFQWDGDDEFWYGGSIYDVIDKKITGNKMTILGINDTQENDLIKKMEEIEKKSAGHNKSEPFAMQQLLSLILFNQNNCVETVLHPIPILYTDHYCKSIKNVIVDINVPPPRRIAVTSSFL